MEQRLVLTGLQAKEYSHPLDLEARTTLEGVPGLAVLVKKTNEIGFDRLLRLQSLATKIRVSERQFPKLYKLFLETKRILDIPYPVDLFIQQSFSLNAFAAGVDYPHVTVTTELVNLLEDDELRFVLGHELGHIRSEHILYHQIGYYLPIIIDIIGSATLGIGRLLGTGVEVALYDWIRKSEFTADRAGLLACQNFEAALSAFSKLAGVPKNYFGMLNPDEIKRQADEFEQLVNQDSANKLIRYLAQLWNTHPWIIIRFQDLTNWHASGSYNRILAKRASGSNLDQDDSYTCSCGRVVPEGYLFCVYCGKYLGGSMDKR